jgi:hypothetical protein
MCKVDGIEVTREEKAAWDAAVASFQQSLRGHLQSIRPSAGIRAEHQQDDLNAGLAAIGS